MSCCTPRRSALIASQSCRQVARDDRIVAAKTFDADLHVLQTPCGIHARPDAETEVGRTQFAGTALRHVDQGRDARVRQPRTNALQPRGDQHAIVVVERHQVGHGAERDQVEQAGKIRLGTPRECAVGTQRRTQREQQVEHHADAGQGLARKAVAAQVRIHDRIGFGQIFRRQMVIGDEHATARLLGRTHAGQAGNAAVDGHEQIGRAVGDDVGDQCRRQSVPVHDAIRHAHLDPARTQHAQTAIRHGRTGRTVAIEIADDEHARIARDRLAQQRAGDIEATERLRRLHARQAQVELFARHHAARRVDTRQHGMQ
jgi:hypothetical protein